MEWESRRDEKSPSNRNWSVHLGCGGKSSLNSWNLILFPTHSAQQQQQQKCNKKNEKNDYDGREISILYQNVIAVECESERRRWEDAGARERERNRIGLRAPATLSRSIISPFWDKWTGTLSAAALLGHIIYMKLFSIKIISATNCCCVVMNLICKKYEMEIALRWAWLCSQSNAFTARYLRLLIWARRDERAADST